MGHKKFHLVVRKNEERKKYATLTSLIVSVPTAKLPVQDLGTMVSQLKTSNALPQTWIVQAAVAASPEETSTNTVKNGVNSIHSWGVPQTGLKLPPRVYSKGVYVPSRV